MSEEAPDWTGIWICGQCGSPTDVTHFYMDRATGVMKHDSNEPRRQIVAERCGWRFDDDYVELYRCLLTHGHYSDEHVASGVRFTSKSFGAIPPYDPASANTSNA